MGRIVKFFLMIVAAAAICWDIAVAKQDILKGTFRYESEFNALTDATTTVGIVTSDYSELTSPLERTTNPSYDQIEEMVEKGDVSIQIAEGTARTNNDPTEPKSVWGNTGYMDLLTDTMLTKDVDQLICDHVSISWGIDGINDLQRGGNFILQWCILGEALNNSLHEEGSHAMLGSYRNPTGNLSLHHNLFTSSRDRYPKLGAECKDVGYTGNITDFRNNVIYNWSRDVYSNESDGLGGTTNFCDNMVVAINKVWQPGPESDPDIQSISLKGNQPDGPHGYMSGNVFSGWEDWKSLLPDQGENVPTTHAARLAYELMLNEAGTSLSRDAMDKRHIQNVRRGMGKLIDSQEEVGEWPEIKSKSAPKVSDQDCMPDLWEKGIGLNPEDPKDRNGDSDGDGFPNLEGYLNSLVGY